MERVSVKDFFTVMWRCVCQALGWFFGLFGYKRDGKYAKCVWGLFATSVTVIMVIIAGFVTYGTWQEVGYKLNRRHYNCMNPDCYESWRLNGDIYYHFRSNSKGYIYNCRTGKKLLKNVEWIAQPHHKDSLVCFSNGKKRGYFSNKTGKVIIEPKYDHAWIFSEGLASVEENGFIKFIDGSGNVVIDNHIAYSPGSDGYVFHSGYCIVYTEDGEWCGLIDKTGKIALPLEYSSIKLTDDFRLWCVHNGREMAVLDREFNPVIPFMDCYIFIDEGTIDVTMPDHTMRKYDFNGELINDFYVSSVRTLEYKKDEILYRTMTHDEEGDEYAVPVVESYHPMATARLRAYVAGDGFEGLMTADGHVVTMPLYSDIEAIGQDLYLCTSTNSDKLIVNGKGEIVR